MCSFQLCIYLNNRIQIRNGFIESRSYFRIERNNRRFIITLLIREQFHPNGFLDFKHYHVTFVPNLPCTLQIIKAKVSQTITNKFIFVILVTTITMLMMIDYGISSTINKEPIGFFHSWTRKLIKLMSSVYNHNYMISIPFSFCNCIILLYRIQRVTSWCCRCGN